jgi:hypothetical protein
MIAKIINSVAYPFQTIFQIFVDIECYELRSSRVLVYDQLKGLEQVSPTSTTLDEIGGNNLVQAPLDLAVILA